MSEQRKGFKPNGELAQGFDQSPKTAWCPKCQRKILIPQLIKGKCPHCKE